MEDEILKICQESITNLNIAGVEDAFIVSGYFQNKKDFDNFLDSLKACNSSYSVRSSRGKNKGIEYSRIKFCEHSGLPYIPGEVIYYECIHGEKYFRDKTHLQELNQDHTTSRRQRLQDTRKLGCESKLWVYLRNVFVEEKYYAPGKRPRTAKTKALDDLREAMASADQPVMQTWFFIRLSTKHNHLLTGQKMNIHPVLRQRIEGLVKSGITCVSTIKILLKEKVDEMIEKNSSLSLASSSMNSSYYPADSVIYCHIRKTLLSLKESGLYHEEVKIKNDDLGSSKKAKKRKRNKSKGKDDTVNEPIKKYTNIYEGVIDESAEHWVVALTCTVETEEECVEEIVEC